MFVACVALLRGCGNSVVITDVFGLSAPLKRNSLFHFRGIFNVCRGQRVKNREGIRPTGQLLLNC